MVAISSQPSRSLPPKTAGHFDRREKSIILITSYLLNNFKVFNLMNILYLHLPKLKDFSPDHRVRNDVEYFLGGSEMVAISSQPSRSLPPKTAGHFDRREKSKKRHWSRREISIRLKRVFEIQFF
jgi:hypothetical protein